MELREVIGNRRSIRYLDPGKPVELEKIQRMLEAARIASHFGNNNAIQALVVHRETATVEQLESLPSPVGGFQMDLAQVVILWYIEGDAMDEAGERLRELVACGALGYGPDKNQELEETLVPLFNSIGEALKGPGMVDMDCASTEMRTLRLSIVSQLSRNDGCMNKRISAMTRSSIRVLSSFPSRS